MRYWHMSKSYSQVGSQTQTVEKKPTEVKSTHIILKARLHTTAPEEEGLNPHQLERKNIPQVDSSLPHIQQRAAELETLLQERILHEGDEAKGTGYRAAVTQMRELATVLFAFTQNYSMHLNEVAATFDLLFYYETNLKKLRTNSSEHKHLASGLNDEELKKMEHIAKAWQSIFESEEARNLPIQAVFDEFRLRIKDLELLKAKVQRLIVIREKLWNEQLDEKEMEQLLQEESDIERYNLSGENIATDALKLKIIEIESQIEAVKEEEEIENQKLLEFRKSKAEVRNSILEYIQKEFKLPDLRAAEAKFEEIMPKIRSLQFDPTTDQMAQSNHLSALVDRVPEFGEIIRDVIKDQHRRAQAFLAEIKEAKPPLTSNQILIKLALAVNRIAALDKYIKENRTSTQKADLEVIKNIYTEAKDVLNLLRRNLRAEASTSRLKNPPAAPPKV